MANKRVHVLCSGRVQGVGFRFTAESMARQLKVFGWVKNLDDGRVEIVAEADEEALKKFLEELRGYFSRYIKDLQVEWEEASGEFKDFGVNF